MAKMCDICGVRPATVRAQVTTSDGETKVLNLCELDYRRLTRQQRSSSPLESLFGGRGSLFDDFFADDFFGGNPLAGGRGRSEEAPEAGDEGSAAPTRSGRGRARGRGAAAGVAERLSEHA